MNYFCVGVLHQTRVNSLNSATAMTLILTQANSFDDAFQRVDSFIASTECALRRSDHSAGKRDLLETWKAWEVFDVYDYGMSATAPVEVYAFRMAPDIETTCDSVRLELPIDCVAAHVPTDQRFVERSPERYYGVSVVQYVRFVDGEQSGYPIWVNVYVTPAQSCRDAIRRVETSEWTLSSEMTHDDRPAELVFAGIRGVFEINLVPGIELSARGPVEIFAFQMDLPTAEDLSEICRGRRIGFHEINP